MIYSEKAIVFLTGISGILWLENSILLLLLLLFHNRHESKCADLFSLSLSLGESHFLVCYV